MNNSNNKNKTIGIMDSGLGGYTYYRYLRQQFPEVSLTFCADQAHVPFGNKKHEELFDYGKAMTEWLIEKGASTILVACNTLSVTVLSQLKEQFPEVHFESVVEFLLANIDDSLMDLAVIGTMKTIDSNTYHEALNHNPERNIVCIATPWLASAIEDMVETSVLKEMIADLKPALQASTHLVLACTHYPIVQDLLKEVLEVETIDGIEPSRDWMASLAVRPLGPSAIYTSGDPNQLEQQVFDLFGEVIEVQYSDFKI